MNYEQEEAERKNAEILLKRIHSRMHVEDIANILNFSVFDIYSAMNRYDNIGGYKCGKFVIREIIKRINESPKLKSLT